LRAFSKISGVTIDLAELEEQANMVERGLNELLERATKQAGGSEEEPPNIPEPSTEPEQEQPSASAMSRIEELFRRARTDKSQAVKLKSELDRLGLFKQFEDRFLDLFKKDEHG